MAINGRFRVGMADVFPAGAFVVGEVEAVRDFDKSTPERFTPVAGNANAYDVGIGGCGPGGSG